MMAETGNGQDTSEDQAIDHTEATDADHISEVLPEDISERLTKRAFSAGSLRKLIRDTYYLGPIGIGSGGWRGVYGDGQPGTEMRRPDGALYNFPRSWRYAALQRGLETGVITHVGGGRFAATERGAAVLDLVDQCPDCEVRREPFLRSSVYVGNPNTDGHVESHSLITACPECGTDGYGQAGDSVQVGFSAWERDEDAVEFAGKMISDHPSARVYGVDREVDADAAFQAPDVDVDAVEELLDERVENQADPSPRAVHPPEDECLYGRQVITIPGEGAHYRFRGTADAVAASRTDGEGDIHITRVDEDTLKVGMSRETAVDKNAKDAISYHEGAEWTGTHWTIDADALGRAVSKLTAGFSEQKRSGMAWFPDTDDAPEDHVEFLTVTVTEDAMDAVDVPMLGVDEDGELI